jgi:hypothetical protein
MSFEAVSNASAAKKQTEKETKRVKIESSTQSITVYLYYAPFPLMSLQPAGWADRDGARKR